MTETSEIGPLARRRRGVAPGTFLIWIILAAVGGAVVWAIYGDGVRSILKLPPASAHWAITQTNQKPTHSDQPQRGRGIGERFASLTAAHRGRSAYDSSTSDVRASGNTSGNKSRI